MMEHRGTDGSTPFLLSHGWYRAPGRVTPERRSLLDQINQGGSAMAGGPGTGALINFLLARIGEDEALLSGACCPVCQEVTCDDDCPWPRAKLFADLEAKRRIVELHGGPHDVCLTAGGLNVTNPDGDCGVMRLVALSYADHPDYRRGWA